MTPYQHHRLDITLRDDLIFSVRTATQGDHESLDRIPGTALWGWAAAWLHRHHPEEAVALAHEGRLQFSDARPLSAGDEPTAPMPLVLAYDKGSVRPHRVGTRLQAEALLNLSHPAADPSTFDQAKNVKGGFLSPSGEQTQPKTRYALKTALNADTGTVVTGKLFGYDSLQAGQRFQGQLRVAADANPAVVQALLQALAGQARLGRSRSGEFGRVRVQVQPVAAPAAPVAQGDRVVVWLLSDALLRDAHGRPCLSPDADLLGLPGARFVRELSALRHRSYSAWNAHRNTYGVERQVLVGGSVLVFERPGQPFTADELAALQAGIGTERHLGLGEVTINSPLLQAMQPAFAAPPVATVVSSSPAPLAPDTALITFLRHKLKATSQGRPEALAQPWLLAVQAHLQSARRYAGVPAAQPLGPTATQWGTLASALESCQGTGDLALKVYDKVLGIAPPPAPDRAQPSRQGRAGVNQSLSAHESWNVRASGDPQSTLGARVQQLIAESFQAPGADWRATLRAVVHACNEIRRSDLHLNKPQPARAA